MQDTSDLPTIEVGYYDPFSVFPGLEADLKKRSIMSKLHWRPYPNDNVKTIESLRIKWVEEIPKSSKPVMLDSPEYFERAINETKESFVKFMFVHSTSIDDYRSKVRPLIRAWLSDNVDNKINKPMWCLVYLEDALEKVGVPFKTNMFNKLRSDFNNYVDDTIERCFKIKSFYTIDTEKLEAWNLLISSIKPGILEAISNKLNYYQNKKFSKNADPKLILIFRDSVAQIFQQLGQIDEAVNSYRQLMISANAYLNLSNGFEGLGLDQIPSLSEIRDTSSYYVQDIEEQNITRSHLLVYLYTKQVHLLLSNKEYTTLQGEAIKIYQKLITISINFITEIHKLDTPSQLKSSEIAFALIKDILQFDDFQHIFHATNLKENSVLMTKLFGELGDLKLIYKDQIVCLAASRGLYIKGNITQNISFENNEYQVSNQDIKNILESQETFEDYIVTLIEEIIQDFENSQHRPRAVDILSTELALMAFHNGDFKASAQILGDSFQYYKSQNWSFIGTHILQYYIKSLEKLREIEGQDDNEKLLEKLLNAYTMIISSSNLVTNIEKQNALLKLEKLSTQLNRTAVFESDSIFNSVEVEPFIINLASDVYSIKINVTSGFELKVKSLKISLVNSSSILEFDTHDYRIISGRSTILLNTKNIEFGSYNLGRLVFTLGNLEIDKVFDSELEVNIFQQEQTDSTGQQETLIPNTVISARVPKKRELDVDLIAFEINSPRECLDNLKFVLYQTGDRIIKTSKFKVTVDSKPLKFDLETLGDQLVFMVKGTVMESSKVIINVPYFFPLADVGSTILEVKFGVSFSKNGLHYSKLTTEAVDTQLTISASVEDIFKSDYLYSNFSVGPSTNNFPVRINTVDLESFCKAGDREPSFTTKKWLQKQNCIAFYGQVATFFYLIQKKEDVLLVEHKNEFLNLLISYTDINEECFQIFKTLFHSVLLKNPLFLKYSRVLDDLFANLNLKLNHYAVSNYLKIKDLNLGHFNDQVFNYIKPADLPILLSILADFFEPFLSKSGMYINDEIRFMAAEEAKKQLKIQVPLNVIQMIHVVEIDFTRKLEFSLGEPIPAKLIVNTYTTWSDLYDESAFVDTSSGTSETTKKKKKVAFLEEEPESLFADLKLDLNISENWLVTGIKSLEIQVSKVYSNKPQTFGPLDIVLIPLKHGKLPLPGINITNFDSGSMHLDYKNSSETIFVSPEAKKVTFTF